jgi:hypothetical protein
LSAETIVINDRVETGDLVSANGAIYPIKNGVPRFLPSAKTSDSVISFGNEWNHFSTMMDLKRTGSHIAEAAFGSTDYFKGKLIVDLRPRNAHQIDVLIRDVPDYRSGPLTFR